MQSMIDFPIEVAMKSAILVPREFVEVAKSFYQGSLVEGMNEFQWISAQVNPLDTKTKAVAKQFLTELLSGPYTDKQLQEVWGEKSDYCFRDKDLRIFLTLVRDAL